MADKSKHTPDVKVRKKRAAKPADLVEEPMKATVTRTLAGVGVQSGTVKVPVAVKKHPAIAVIEEYEKRCTTGTTISLGEMRELKRRVSEVL